MNHLSLLDSLLTFPADDETDMEELQKNVKAIEMDGLVWGASKLVAVGFGIKKLQINLVVEDEKVSLEDLQEKIAEDEDHVQSSDIVRSRFMLPLFSYANCFPGCNAEVVEASSGSCIRKSSTTTSCD